MGAGSKLFKGGFTAVYIGLKASDLMAGLVGKQGICVYICICIYIYRSYWGYIPSFPTSHQYV